MGGIQESVEIASLKSALLASILDLSPSPGHVSLIQSTGCHLLGAVGERSSFDGVEKLSTLESLVSNIVTGMGSGHSSKEGEACDSICETHLLNWCASR